MNTVHNKSCSCGCCEGIESLTPEDTSNEAGLQDLRYRVGTHGAFKESMLKGLASAPNFNESVASVDIDPEVEALALARYKLSRDLTTRADDDPTIALMDAWAVVLDVLTFYQERIIQEGYIRTSKERLSLVELARHISYRPKPGVAAGAWFSFLMDESPGAPTEAKVPVGTKVQSIPGQDEKPQAFETIETIQARTRWNAIKPQLTAVQTQGKGSTSLYLKGTNTQLQKGDRVLIVGEERFKDPGSERWDIRIVQSVIPDEGADRTLITWRDGLGHNAPLVYPGSKAKVYAFRQRAALFGYNAPDPRVFSNDVKTALSISGNPSVWPNFSLPASPHKTIYLDTVYPKILNRSWIALERPNYTELYQVVDIKADAKTEFSIPSKSSKILLDTDENLSGFGLRETVVFAQSEELFLSEAPVLSPVFGKKIMLSEYFRGLTKGQKLIISGEPVRWIKVTERQRVTRIGYSEHIENVPLDFIPNSGGQVELKTDEVLEVVETPLELSGNKLKWTVRQNGVSGYIDAGIDDVIPYVPEKNGALSQPPTSLNQPEVVSELIEIDVLGQTYITLKAPLKYAYIRSTVKINANVAEATHGETKMEVLGSGNGSLVFQKFKLKQKPLTYISADSSSGSESTLEIRVNDIQWHESPTFYGKGPTERIFVTRTEDDGTVYVQFGDGITGARLPSGTENVRATYRIGTGMQGLLDAGQLSLLLSPQLGLKSVSNSLPTSDAEDPEAIKDIRKNAPQTVLSLDRIVSILDYQYFANAFAGIGKARADLLWQGENRTLHLTVAAADEGEVGKELKGKLSKAIDTARHDLFPVVINSLTKIYFNIVANIKIAPDYLAEKVIAQVREILMESYSFESRDFGQSLSPSEIIAVMQSVEGVLAVDLDILDGKNPFGTPFFRLISHTAKWSGNTILAAELLLIDPNNIVLNTWSDES